MNWGSKRERQRKRRKAKDSHNYPGLGLNFNPFFAFLNKLGAQMFCYISHDQKLFIHFGTSTTKTYLILNATMANSGFRTVIIVSYYFHFLQQKCSTWYNKAFRLTVSL